MSRVSLFSAPFLLGFDVLEERLDYLTKASDGYPPYNIEHQEAEDGAEKFLISIAVAGFSREELEIIVEDTQLIVLGRQKNDDDRQFLHRGIATRQFKRTFLLAHSMQIEGAELRDGLLEIRALRPNVEQASKRIDIKVVA